MNQTNQRDLLTQIDSINQMIETHYMNKVEESDHQRLREKIHQFQTFNQEYIQNLKKNHGLIQFEIGHLQNQDYDVDELISLNKIPLSPNSSKAVKSKKAKKS